MQDQVSPSCVISQLSIMVNLSAARKHVRTKCTPACWTPCAKRRRMSNATSAPEHADCPPAKAQKQGGISSSRVPLVHLSQRRQRWNPLPTPCNYAQSVTAKLEADKCVCLSVENLQVQIPWLDRKPLHMCTILHMDICRFSQKVEWHIAPATLVDNILALGRQVSSAISLF